jgi:hypothetical protein
MSDNGTNGAADRAKVLKTEEATVTAVLQSKLTSQNCLRESDRQLVSYRIAEIMVEAKELYTKELPRIAADRGVEEEYDMFSELAGLRMSFLHLRDLITDFDEAFMIAMSHQRDDDDDGDDDGESESDKEEPDEDIESENDESDEP